MIHRLEAWVSEADGTLRAWCACGTMLVADPPAVPVPLEVRAQLAIETHRLGLRRRRRR